MYVVGVYKYDTLSDIINSINLGENSTAYMVNHDGIITGHPDESQVLSENTLSQINGGNEDAVARIPQMRQAPSNCPSTERRC